MLDTASETLCQNICSSVSQKINNCSSPRSHDSGVKRTKRKLESRSSITPLFSVPIFVLITIPIFLAPACFGILKGRNSSIFCSNFCFDNHPNISSPSVFWNPQGDKVASGKRKVALINNMRISSTSVEKLVTRLGKRNKGPTRLRMPGMTPNENLYFRLLHL